MIDFLKTLYRSDVNPLNYVKIYKGNILHNLRVLQSYQTQSELFPVLKSNAYGHGLRKISEILGETGGKYICVDSFPEYQIVKKYSGKQVLVLGETRSENYIYYNFKYTSFCIYNLETLQYLISLDKKITIHLFLNTGMNREGFQEKELKKALSHLQNTKIIVEGVCSHFASADEKDLYFYNKQITEFKRLYEIILSYNFHPKYRHIGASAAILKMEDNFFNAFRPGISVFGINVLEKEDIYYDKGKNLQLCMSIHSTVQKIQNISAGEAIGYNGTYHSSQDTKIAIIPFGYYEGFDGRLSNNYFVKIKGKYYPIRGKICMNIAMVEIGNDDIKLGDEVEIVSKNKKDKNTVYTMAFLSQTNIYEIMVKIKANIHRKIV